MIEVLFPGVLSTVQDLGRRGYRAYGVPRSGALDVYSYLAGNLILGNGSGAASIEVIGGLFKFRTLTRLSFVVTGAEVALEVDGSEAETWKAIELDRGSTVSLGRPKRGFISYISFSGGIDVEPVLGSRSTYLPGRFGGLEGRPLKKGDRLKLGRSEGRSSRLPKPSMPDGLTAVRATPGMHSELFPKMELFDNVYRVTPESNRMGYRLDGPRIECRAEGRLASFPVNEGFVQVPQAGRPIVLLADGQTVGGYPVIASVIPPDIGLVAQSGPGMKLRFELINYERAERLTAEWLRRLGLPTF